MEKKSEIGQVKKRYQALILAMINQFIPTGKVILFGSRATGHTRPGSDIDLVIDVGQKISDGSIELLRIELEEELNVPIKVDLSDFYDLPQVMQKEVCERGIVWRY